MREAFMLKKDNLQVFNLRLFDDGGTATPVEQTTQPTDNTSGEGGLLNDSNVRKKTFDDLIKGEYKDLYTENTNKIVNSRFKDYKTLEEKVSSTDPVLGILMQKYGVSNVQELQSAVENDDSNFEDEAFKRGLTVEQYRQMHKAETENTHLKGMLERNNREQRSQQVMGKWNAEANDIKQAYPDFDFNSEITNPQFTRLLGNGIDMKTAYEVLHMGDIKKGIETTTSKNVTDTIRAKGSRPSEGGASSSFSINKDVGSLNKNEMQDLKKRIAKGERISFG